MSLKAFHLVFITISTLLAFGIGAWLLRDYFSPEGRVTDLAFGLASVAAGVALIVYERYFLKKTKGMSYL
jgi:hypothetical protein